MVVIENKNDLGLWLEGKPSQVSIIIAARAASRAAQYLHVAFRPNAQLAGRLALASFRAIVIAWGSVAGIDRQASAAYAAAASSYAKNSRVGVATGQHYAIDVALGATLAAAYAADASAVSAVNVAASSSYAADDDGPEMVWRAVSSDCTEIDRGISPQQLAAYPLFIGEAADLTKRFSQMWSLSQNIFRPRGEGWDVWFPWLSESISGFPHSPVFERAVLTLEEEEWRNDPPEVNARLKKLMEEYKIVPQVTETEGAMVSASDRLVSVRDNQEPFDVINEANNELEKRFIQDQNNLRFHLPYYDEFLASIQLLKRQIQEGWVEADLLRGRYREYLELLAKDLKTYATIIGIPTGMLVAVVTAISKIFGG